MSIPAINKLVRDHIPKRIQELGYKYELKKLSGEELKCALKDKVLEEAKEVFESKTSEELIEELGDLLTVLYALAEQSNISFEQIEDKRKDKNREKGVFNQGYYIYNVAVDPPRKV